MLDASAYERALRPLLRQGAAYAQSILRHRADAEDAVQQAALRGWERIAQYHPSRPFKAWWFTLLRNCCIDILRKRRSNDTETLNDIDLVDKSETNPFEWQSLDRNLRQLNTHHQEILRLKYFAELSYEGLADVLQIPKGTVMSRLHLARKALAKKLGEEIE